MITGTTKTGSMVRLWRNEDTWSRSPRESLKRTTAAKNLSGSLEKIIWTINGVMRPKGHYIDVFDQASQCVTTCRWYCPADFMAGQERKEDGQERTNRDVAGFERKMGADTGMLPFAEKQ